MAKGNGWSELTPHFRGQPAPLTLARTPLPPRHDSDNDIPLVLKPMSASQKPSNNPARISIVALVISAISCYFSIQAYKHTAREYAAERREECLLLITQALQEYDSATSDTDAYLQSYKSMRFDLDTYRTELATYANEAIGDDRKDLQGQLVDLAKTSAQMATNIAQGILARKEYDKTKVKITDELNALQTDAILDTTDPAWWLTERRHLTALQEDLRKAHQTLLKASADFQRKKAKFLVDKANTESLLKFHNLLFFWRNRSLTQSPPPD